MLLDELVYVVVWCCVVWCWLVCSSSASAALLLIGLGLAPDRAESTSDTTQTGKEKGTTKGKGFNMRKIITDIEWPEFISPRHLVP